MANPTAEVLQLLKRWVRVSDGTKVRFREDGQKGIVDGLAELAVGSNHNPDQGQYCVNTGATSRISAIEGDLLVLTDENRVVLMVKQKGEYRRVVISTVAGNVCH